MRIENVNSAVNVASQTAKNETANASVLEKTELEWAFHTNFGKGAATFEILSGGAEPTPEEQLNDVSSAKQAATTAAATMVTNADEAKRAQANTPPDEVLSLISQKTE